jgi:saccharopine dehydrogenase-like NADP-dependent oxidoreductase
MHRVLVLGAGKIGRAIAALLHDSGAYAVLVADASQAALDKLAAMVPAKSVIVDATNRQQLESLMQDCDSVVSALMFAHNPLVAEVAVRTRTSYFDLTEDVATTRAVRALEPQCADGCILMPQCGLAPGFISVAAQHLVNQFESIDSVHMRVGALPQFPTNALRYNLTWSTDGLINEYCNPCEAIHDGKLIDALPMEGYEQFSLDGVRYEAFNTSGGLGSLCESLAGQVRELNYRTIRYMGHRDLMQFLLRDLRMADKRPQLKELMEDAIPVTYQDVVITFVTVTGIRQNQLAQLVDARKIYHQDINGMHWSAIQITTAAGICGAVDLHATGKLPRQGFVQQERIALNDFVKNRFGKYYTGSPVSTTDVMPQTSLVFPGKSTP